MLFILFGLLYKNRDYNSPKDNFYSVFKKSSATSSPYLMLVLNRMLIKERLRLLEIASSICKDEDEDGQFQVFVQQILIIS